MEPDGPRPRIALALGGGAARGLSHIGVLEVFEREGLRPDCIVGTSMGALIGGLFAAGVSCAEVVELARAFRFPRSFVFGGMLRWESLFGSAIPRLGGRFEELGTRLLVTAVNVESGSQVIIHTGALLPAIQASSSVPGIMPPVRLGGDWLIDGGIVNVLPVDVTWVEDPDVVVAVDLGGAGGRRMPYLDWRSTALLSRLGEIVPNPGTAKIALELMIRASEIMLDRQTTLATAMTGPDVLIRPALGDIGLRDFHRLDEALAAGRTAAESVLPEVRRLLDGPANGEPRSGTRRFFFDPVCAMVISPSRARASIDHAGTTYRFCSENCRDAFARSPARYLYRSPMQP